MKLVVTEFGEKLLLDTALKATSPDDPQLEVALFVNSWIIRRNTKWSELTEATFGGYARIDLDRDTWESAITLNGAAYSQYSNVPLSWTCSSGFDEVFGYAVLDKASEEIVWACRFSTSRVVSPTSILEVLVVLTGQSESLEGS